MIYSSIKVKLIYLQIFLLAIGTAFSQADCNKYPSGYIPKNLDDALNYLDCVWPNKNEFKNKNEKDAVGNAHFARGQWIRNGWGLLEGKSPLYAQFKSLGITFPENISSIILTSFHRRLNNKDIDLHGQVQEYQENAKRYKSTLAERNKLAKRLEIGDTVNVVFSRSQSTKDTYTLALLNYESSLNQPTNCIVQGQVKQRRKQKAVAF
jgi:hypothetical protein